MKSILWTIIFIPVVLVLCQAQPNQTRTTKTCGNRTCPFWSTCNNYTQSGETECGSCMAGFVGDNCTDRDECTILGYDPCARFGTGVCVNNLGGYNCSCLVGWTGARCQIVDENVTASERTCLPGYVNHAYNNSYGDCRDIDECSNSSTNTCGPHQHCVNTAGSYKCNCNIGWEGLLCTEDIDECSQANICGIHQHCVNNDGSFLCICDIGWEGFNCEQDIDECSQANICGIHQHCINNDGSFSCICDIGWEGFNCTHDMYECKQANTCGIHQHCVNNDGSFSCICDIGWEGSLCTEDIDECKQANICGMHQHCVNNNGSHSCICDIGWMGVGCMEDVNTVDHTTNKDGGLMHVAQSSQHVRENLDDPQKSKLDVVLGSVFARKTKWDRRKKTITCVWKVTASQGFSLLTQMGVFKQLNQKVDFDHI